METPIYAAQHVERIFEKYSDLVYRTAFLLLKNSAEAEDTLQNVFLKLIQHKKGFESYDHVKAWLITTTKNAAKDLLKSFWHRKTAGLETATETLSCYSENSDTNEIYAAVMGLKAKYRLPLYLFYYEGYTTEEIAKILSIKHATVRSQLRTARQNLKLIIEEEHEYERT